MGFQKILQDYILNTSVDGIQRVFFPVGNEAPGKYFRLVWLLAWLLSTIYMTKQITDIFKQYFQSGIRKDAGTTFKDSKLDFARKNSKETRSKLETILSIDWIHEVKPRTKDPATEDSMKPGTIERAP